MSENEDLEFVPIEKTQKYLKFSAVIIDEDFIHTWIFHDPYYRSAWLWILLNAYWIDPSTCEFEIDLYDISEWAMTPDKMVYLLERLEEDGYVKIEKPKDYEWLITVIKPMATIRVTGVWWTWPLGMID